MLKKLIPLFLIRGLILCHCGICQPTVTLENFASGFTKPVKITHANDSRLFIAEMDGKIRIIKNGAVLSEPFLDIADRINHPEWAGILSIGFPPDYQTSGLFYVLYFPKNSLQIQLSLFRKSADKVDKADATSEVQLLTIPYGNLSDGHRGGDIGFDNDSYLYISTGDNGPGSRGVTGDPDNNAQNMNVIFGKILRLEPATQSFVENPSDKIFAAGLRNPWRMSFDRSTGDLWIGDNGQDDWEEINYIKYPFTESVYNFGWSCKEGNSPYTAAHCTEGTTYISPKLIYPGFNQNGTTSSASVIGGYVYRGSLYPSLAGYYFFGDYSSGKIGYSNSAGSGGFISGVSLSSVVSFGEDQEGELYALSFDSGNLFKLKTTGSALPVKLESFGARPEHCSMNLQWRTTCESNFSHFELERSKDLKKFERIVTKKALGDNLYRYTDSAPSSTPFYYRLKMVDLDGTFAYSTIVVAMMNCPEQASTVSPNPTKGSFMVTPNGENCDIHVFNSRGERVSDTKLMPDKSCGIDLTGYPADIYYVRIISKAGTLLDALKVVTY